MTSSFRDGHTERSDVMTRPRTSLTGARPLRDPPSSTLPHQVLAQLATHRSSPSDRREFVAALPGSHSQGYPGPSAPTSSGNSSFGPGRIGEGKHPTRHGIFHRCHRHYGGCVLTSEAASPSRRSAMLSRDELPGSLRFVWLQASRACPPAIIDRLGAFGMWIGWWARRTAGPGVGRPEVSGVLGTAILAAQPVAGGFPQHL